MSEATEDFVVPPFTSLVLAPPVLQSRAVLVVVAPPAPLPIALVVTPQPIPVAPAPLTVVPMREEAPAPIVVPTRPPKPFRN